MEDPQRSEHLKNLKIWPEIWKYLSLPQKEKEKKNWLIQRPKRDAARFKRGIGIVVPEEDVAERGRLGPGEMIGVNLAEGRLYHDAELKQALSEKASAQDDEELEKRVAEQINLMNKSVNAINERIDYLEELIEITNIE